MNNITETNPNSRLLERLAQLEPTLENIGYMSFYRGVAREELETEEEQEGWDEAFGFECYTKEVWKDEEEEKKNGWMK